VRLTNAKSLMASICRGAAVAAALEISAYTAFTAVGFSNRERKPELLPLNAADPLSKTMNKDQRIKERLVSTHTKSDRACPVDFGAKTRITFSTDAGRAGCR